MNISETIEAIASINNELNNLDLINLSFNLPYSDVTKVTIDDKDLLIQIDTVKSILTKHRKDLIDTRNHLIKHLRGLLL